MFAPENSEALVFDEFINALKEAMASHCEQSFPAEKTECIEEAESLVNEVHV